MENAFKKTQLHFQPKACLSKGMFKPCLELYASWQDVLALNFAGSVSAVENKQLYTPEIQKGYGLFKWGWKVFFKLFRQHWAHLESLSESCFSVFYFNLG